MGSHSRLKPARTDAKKCLRKKTNQSLRQEKDNSEPFWAISSANSTKRRTKKFVEMKIFRVLLVCSGMLCVMSAPTLDGLLGGGGGDGDLKGGLLGGLPDKGGLFGGLLGGLGGDGRSENLQGGGADGFLSLLPNIIGEIFAAKAQLIGRLFSTILGGGGGGDGEARGLDLGALLGGLGGFGGSDRQGRVRTVTLVEEEVKR